MRTVITPRRSVFVAACMTQDCVGPDWLLIVFWISPSSSARDSALLLMSNCDAVFVVSSPRHSRARFPGAAVLLGAGCWYPAAKLGELVSPPGNSAAIQIAIDKGPLVVPLVCLGLVPALAEEEVFRGVLARARARRSAALAIVVSAVAFSVYHLAPAQMLGTLPLAHELGVLAERSGSVVPGMVAHLLNNAIV